MINFAVINKALADQLNNNPAVAELFSNKIERGNYINEDAGQAPWAGIYRGEVSYEPRTLGPGIENWEGKPKSRIAVQAASYETGEDCEELIESYIKVIIEAVLTDTTIGGSVDMVTGFSVEYSYNETERETLYFQTAIITLDLEVATS